MPHKYFHGFGEFDDVFASYGTDDLIYIQSYGSSLVFALSLDLKFLHRLFSTQSIAAIDTFVSHEFVTPNFAHEAVLRFITPHHISSLAENVSFAYCYGHSQSCNSAFCD
ncbi:hypothetical protein JHK85_044831 [Glycine max]|nr:hypothetical protein JHK85_044831 [Glycine max]